MITRVEIEGFKSLRHFAIDLEPLTTIVGPNAAGKSNFFDALFLLSRLADAEVTTALATGRGTRSDQFSRGLQGESVQRIRLGVELLLNRSAAPEPASRIDPESAQQTRFRYELDLARERTITGIERLILKEEGLHPLTSTDDGPWLAHHPELAPFAYHDRPWEWVRMEESPTPLPASRRVLRWTQEEGRIPCSLMMGTAGTERSLLTYPLGLAGPPPDLIESVREALRTFRFLHLEPTKLRLSSDRAAPTYLAYDGSNLPTALAALTPDVRAQICADVARLVPTFKAFYTELYDDQFRIEVELTSGQRLPARVLSDGTLRLLAVFLLLRTATPGALIGIEEPENGVHPESLQTLMRDLIDATTPHGMMPPQVLLISHSPTVVASLQDRPESLVLVDMVPHIDGHMTRTRHVEAIGKRKARDIPTASMEELDRILQTAKPIKERPSSTDAVVRRTSHG